MTHPRKRLIRKPMILGVFCVVLALIVDRYSKDAIMAVMEMRFPKTIDLLPFFSLTEVWNRGVSFGLFAADDAQGVWMLKIFAVCISSILLFLMFRTRSLVEGAAYGLIIGGAWGNVWDRAVYKAVYDFLDFHAFGWNFWVFNIADVAINIGVLLLIIASFLKEKEIKEGTQSV